LGEILLQGFIYKMSTYPHTQSHALLQDLDVTVCVFGTKLMLSALPGGVSLCVCVIDCYSNCLLLVSWCIRRFGVSNFRNSKEMLHWCSYI